MAGTHVRCSDHVHKKLKEICDREGVSLAHALELMVDQAGAGRGPSGAVPQEDPGARLTEPQPRESAPHQHPRQEAQTSGEPFPDNPGPAAPGSGGGSQSTQERLLDRVETLLDRLELLGSEGPEDHVHGERPDCPTCEDQRVTELRQAYNNGHSGGMKEMKDHFLGIPSVKLIHDRYEEAKAKLQQAGGEGQTTVNVVGEGGAE